MLLCLFYKYVHRGYFFCRIQKDPKLVRCDYIQLVLKTPVLKSLYKFLFYRCQRAPKKTNCAPQLNFAVHNVLNWGVAQLSKVSTAMTLWTVSRDNFLRNLRVYQQNVQGASQGSPEVWAGVTSFLSPAILQDFGHLQWHWIWIRTPLKGA